MREKDEQLIRLRDNSNLFIANLQVQQSLNPHSSLTTTYNNNGNYDKNKYDDSITL
jgi:hypothetical protein